MEKSLLDVLKMLFPLGARKRNLLARMAPFLSPQEHADVRYFARLRKVGFHEERFRTETLPDASWPQLSMAVEEEQLLSFCDHINRKVADGVKLHLFQQLRADALTKVSQLVAQNLQGLEDAKEAAALQLFAQEPIHILLIGDPGTGKTEILRSIERLAPQSVFGLGSGTSKAGLTGLYDGKEFHPGLLCQADEGVVLIDELNLLKKEDRAGLYSAMEKGFVTYDKKGRHERFNARVCVLATANPKGDKFIGKDLKFLRSQLPFDEALLSRFHLVFLVRKPGEKELELIARKIVRDEMKSLPGGDAQLVREYVAYAEKLIVSFNEKYESMVVDFIEQLKSRESQALLEVGPRLVIGVIRMAKAAARSRLSRTVNGDDLERAMRLMKSALLIQK